MRGALIVIEGLDRAGKSTQVEILHNRLIEMGRKTMLMKFPDRSTTIGQMINSYLTDSKEQICDEAIHLLFSANRWELAPKLISSLDAGFDVILDRYVYSGIAFSAAKNVSSMSIEWCKQPDVGLPAADLTIFLDVSEAVAQQRGGYGQERYEKIEFQRKVREMFYQLVNNDDRCVRISADGDVSQVSYQIFEHIGVVLKSQLVGIRRFH
jgi:dTMP kinase